MEVILGYNNFFEKEAVEIEEKIKKLEQVKEMTLVEIRDKIKSDKNYEFWFLINNIYFLLSFEKINLRTVQNFFTEIKKIKKIDFMDNYSKTKKDIIQIDEETMLNTKNSTLLMQVTISDIIDHYYGKENILENSIKEKCANCKMNIICEFENCIKIKKVNEKIKKEVDLGWD